LQVNKGTLNVLNRSGLGGLEFLTDPGTNGLSTLIMRGSLAEINLALDRLSYTSRYNFNGLDTLTIGVIDGGVAGTEGILETILGLPRIDTGTVKIKVA
jgi:hypothetical protein